MISRQPVFTTFLLNTICLTCISFNIINKNSSRCSSIILLPWTEKRNWGISKNNWKGNVIGPEAPCFFPASSSNLCLLLGHLCLTRLLHLLLHYPYDQSCYFQTYPFKRYGKLYLQNKHQQNCFA